MEWVLLHSSAKIILTRSRIFTRKSDRTENNLIPLCIFLPAEFFVEDVATVMFLTSAGSDAKEKGASVYGIYIKTKEINRGDRLTRVR